MIDSHGNWHRNDAQIESEKLYRILDKLNSIKRGAQIRGESEQFILGLLTSTDVVSAELRGEIQTIDESIDYPNQIPLI